MSQSSGGARLLTVTLEQLIIRNRFFAVLALGQLSVAAQLFICALFDNSDFLAIPFGARKARLDPAFAWLWP